MISIDRRASAFGVFTAGYGVSWFLGSTVIGLLFGISLPAVVIFSMASECIALPFFISARRRVGAGGLAQ